MEGPSSQTPRRMKSRTKCAIYSEESGYIKSDAWKPNS